MASSSAELTKKETWKQEKKDESAVYSEELTPLQKHVSFFDRNKDGLIYPSETYKGMRAIGSSVVASFVAAIFVNGGLAGKTSPGKFPSLWFPIYVKNVKAGKHGSDTEAYDSEGRFVQAKFDEIFKKHAKTKHDALTSEELQAMLKENRLPHDFLGMIASTAEWKFLYTISKDKDGFMRKKIVKGVYDGSLFFQLEENAHAKKSKQ